VICRHLSAHHFTDEDNIWQPQFLCLSSCFLDWLLTLAAVSRHVTDHVRNRLKTFLFDANTYQHSCSQCRFDCITDTVIIIVQ